MTPPKPPLLTINVNDSVWVRLNDHGEKQWADSWHLTSPAGVPDVIRKGVTERDGWVRFQLWELMHIFGEAMYNGSDRLPFSGNKVRISLEKKP